MNKILISVEKEYLSFFKYNGEINEKNLNKTNVIDTNNLKFTEDYINENIDLVASYINYIIFKFKINHVIIKNLEIAEIVLILLKRLNNIKFVNFIENKPLTSKISNLLLENKKIEKIECYSLPLIMFYKFNRNQIITRSKIVSSSKFLKNNNINTYSDLFNKEVIMIERINNDDIQSIYYFFNNNKNLKKIELKKYNRKNLNGLIQLLNKNNLKNVTIVIYETKETTKQILNDINLFDKLSKQYKVNIKIKYSNQYIKKNMIKQLNEINLKKILVVCFVMGIVLLFLCKYLERKDNKEIQENIDQINHIINEVENETNNNLNINEEIDDLNENNFEEIESPKETYISSYYQNYSKVYNELLSVNEETIGWITVNNTNVNYPVVQTKDNDYYLNHAYDKTNNIAGWIFVDYRNNMSVIDKNTIIYGHSGLKGNLMFSSLEKVLNNDWYSNENNLNINFSIKNNNYTWRIFSIYTIEKTNDYLYTNFSTEDKYLSFIDKIKSRSINDFNVEVNTNDKILTLSTCYKDDKHRLVIHAKMLQ